MENHQDLSDKEIFARFTHGSSDESESNCGPYWAPVVSPVIPSKIRTTVGGFLVNHHLFLRCSIEKAFVNTNLPLPPGTPPVWRPGRVPGEWSDVSGFKVNVYLRENWQPCIESTVNRNHNRVTSCKLEGLSSSDGKPQNVRRVHDEK